MGFGVRILGVGVAHFSARRAPRIRASGTRDRASLHPLPVPDKPAPAHPPRTLDASARFVSPPPHAPLRTPARLETWGGGDSGLSVERVAGGCESGGGFVGVNRGGPGGRRCAEGDKCTPSRASRRVPPLQRHVPPLPVRPTPALSKCLHFHQDQCRVRSVVGGRGSCTVSRTPWHEGGGCASPRRYGRKVTGVRPGRDTRDVSAYGTSHM